MAGRDVTIADVEKNCPHFKSHQSRYTGLNGHPRSPVLQDGCIVKPGEFKTLGEVTDILASKVPQDKEGKKALANDLQDSHRLSYIEGKKTGKRGPSAESGCPFIFTKEGKPVLDPPSAIGSVFLTKATIEKKCKAFKEGKACPYKLKELNGLGEGCPEFKDGKCPFDNFKDIGEVKKLLGKMRDAHTSPKAKENTLKAIKIIHEANQAEAKVIGVCPFSNYGCHFAADLNGKPIEN